METLLFHPKIVHLPIALAVLMPLVSAGLLVAWMRNLLPRRAWIVAFALQAVLVGASFLAMRTGEHDEETVEAVVAESAIEAHEEAAELFTWTAAAALLLFAGASLLPSEPLARRSAMAATAASVFVLFLGYRVGDAGGALVYEYGAASAFVSGAAGGGGDAGEAAGLDAYGEQDDD